MIPTDIPTSNSLKVFMNNLSSSHCPDLISNVSFISAICFIAVRNVTNKITIFPLSYS